MWLRWSVFDRPPYDRRPSNSTCKRAEDKFETLEMYGTRYTRPDAQTHHSDETEKYDRKFYPGPWLRTLSQFPHTRFQLWCCWSTGGRKCITRIPYGKRDRWISPERRWQPPSSWGRGRKHIKCIMHRAGKPRVYPLLPLDFEDVTNASEMVEITPRYNLRSRPGRNV